MSGRVRTALLLALVAGLAGCEATDPTTPGLFDESALARSAEPVGATGWRWATGDGLRCRDGSATGFGLRVVPRSRRLLVVLQGGGLCSTPETCGRNDASFGRGDFEAAMAVVRNRGVFSPRDDNPLAGWNAVFVPYCTGDLHLGSATDRAVEGVPGLQQFVGYSNLQAVVDRIAGDVREAEAIVLAGVSAGGFGATGAYGLFAERLAPAPVHLLDDAGPFLPDTTAFSPALRRHLAELWSVGPALPAGCAACHGDEGLAALLPHYARRYPDRAFGIVAFDDDPALRNLFGAVGPACAEDPGPLCRLSLPAYRAGLRSLRDSLAATPNAGTFVLSGRGHGSILTDTLPDLQSDGVRLADWIGDVADGGEVPDVGEPGS